MYAHVRLYAYVCDLPLTVHFVCKHLMRALVRCVCVCVCARARARAGEYVRGGGGGGVGGGCVSACVHVHMCFCVRMSSYFRKIV